MGPHATTAAPAHTDTPTHTHTHKHTNTHNSTNPGSPCPRRAHDINLPQLFYCFHSEPDRADSRAAVSLGGLAWHAGNGHATFADNSSGETQV